MNLDDYMLVALLLLLTSLSATPTPFLTLGSTLRVAAFTPQLEIPELKLLLWLSASGLVAMLQSTFARNKRIPARQVTASLASLLRARQNGATTASL